MTSAGYDDDLAYIHDAGFTGLAQRAAEFVLELLRARGIGAGHVVELGCGTGVTAARLVAAGHEVEGLDQSEAMLTIARARVPGARFRRGSFLTAPLPECDAVLAIGEVLNYAFDPRASHASLATIFDRVRRALRPGGVLVFDLAGPGRAARGRHWTAGADWAVLAESEEDRDGRVLTRRIISFRAHGDGYRRSDETHTLLLHPPSEVLELLRAAGFEATTRSGYGAGPLGPGLAVFVAGKPSLE